MSNEYYVLGAERFSKEDAEELLNHDPDKWAIYKCSDVDQRLHLVYDNQDNKRIGTDAPCGWPSGYATPPDEITTLRQQLAEANEKLHLLADGANRDTKLIESRTAQLAAAKGQGEPVYQVWNDDDYPSHWEDVSEADYRLAKEDDRRLLYTAPAPSTVKDSLTTVIKETRVDCRPVKSEVLKGGV